MSGVYVKAAVNGGRSVAAHPGVPVTPAQIGAAAAAARRAGAAVVHAHARTPDGGQSIAPEDVAAMVLAVRAADPEVVVGTTTGLWTCSGHAERMQLVAAWDVRPDFASVAFSEEGAAEAASLVVSMGMDLESAVWSEADVPALLASPTLHRNVRVLIEPEVEDPQEAVAACRRIAASLVEAGVSCPLLYHGDGATVWPVVRAAIEDGAQTRIGFEDGVDLPDGSVAASNTQLLDAVFAEAAATA